LHYLRSDQYSTPSLRDSLLAAGVTRLERLLPWFNRSSVHSTNPIGEPVTLDDLSDIYIAHLAAPVDIAPLVSRISKLPDVHYACDDRPERATLFTPNDTYYQDNQQWTLQTIGHPICLSGPIPDTDINAHTAWDLTRGDPSVRVAILDTGLDDTHTDLASAFIDTSFVPNTTGFDDDVVRHGTAVAGIIAATGNNARGIAGIAWGATVGAFKVLDSGGEGPPSHPARAIDYARQKGYPIINASVGFVDPDFDPHPEDAGSRKFLNTMCLNAFKAGHLIVASIGNFSDATKLYPAAFSKRVCAVGAVWLDGVRWQDVRITDNPNHRDGSNYGSWIDLSAPGGQMVITTKAGPNGYYDLSECKSHLGQLGYMAFGQTSGAAAIVSGVAALLKSARPQLLGEDIQQILNRTAKDVFEFPASAGYDTLTGHGIVRAREALDFVSPPRQVFQGLISNLAVLDSSELITRTFLNVPSLPIDGPYLCRRYRLQGEMPIPFAPPEFPDTWARASGTVGVKDTATYDYDEEVNWAEGGVTFDFMARFTTYVYRIPGMSGSGWFPAPASEARIAFTAIGASPTYAGVPERGGTRLVTVQPNPVVGSARCVFELPLRARVQASVHDLAGRTVATLANGFYEAGRHELEWNIGDSERRLASGVYFVRVEAAGVVSTRKVVLLGRSER